MPTEEIFTTPDYRRVEGTVRATRPVPLLGGVLVDGLRIRFEVGRAVEVHADRSHDRQARGRRGRNRAGWCAGPDHPRRRLGARAGERRCAGAPFVVRDGA
jgi:hypothetical protein